MKTFKNRRFSDMIVIMPFCIITLMFLLVFFSFHFIINQYTDLLTSDNMETEFKIMDEIYSADGSNDEYVTWGMEDSVIAIPTEYMILDAHSNVCFASEEYYLHKLDTADFIARYLAAHDLPLDGQTKKLRVEDKTYLISSKIYEGVYEDGFVLKAEAGTPADTYLNVVYMDITEIQKLVQTINRSLMVILICVGVLAMIFVFYRIKKLRTAFRTLEQYLVKIGNREQIAQIPQFSYEEFSQIVNTVDEMSDRIAQSEQQQKQFFQNASHELRTPLMSIQGYAEGLRYGVMKDTAGCCDVILEESRRMSALVDEILFLSKFETQELAKDTIEVENMLYDCGSQLYIAQYSHIDIVWDIAKDLTIVGDETLLQRAFSNILSNALRYAKSKVCVTAKLENACLKVHMVDDGDGIAPPDLPHIFERFYKGKGGNFGIGLSMTKDIIDRHGGKIIVDSQKGRTDFCVEIPKD